MKTFNNHEITSSDGSFTVALKASRDKKKFKRRINMMTLSNAWQSLTKTHPDIKCLDTCFTPSGVLTNPQRLSEIHNQVRSYGHELGYIVKSVKNSKTKTPKFTLQIRFDSVPIYVLGPTEHESEFSDTITKLTNVVGMTIPSVTKTDSKHFKPTTLLEGNVEVRQIHDFMSVPSHSQAGDYFYLGCGYEVTNAIKTAVKITVQQNEKNYECNDVLAFERFFAGIFDGCSVDTLKRQYTQLLKDISRPNELHKNFGELYVAMYVSLILDKTLHVFVPKSGSAPISDLVFANNNNFFEVSVKDISGGANCSAPEFLKTIQLNPTTPQHCLDFVYLVNLPIKPSTINMYNGDSSLHNLIISLIKRYENWDELEERFKKIELEWFHDIKKVTVTTLLKFLAKDIVFGRTVFDEIRQHISLNQYLKHVKTDIDGSVLFCKFDPDKLTYSTPKKHRENCTMSLNRFVTDNNEF